MLHGVMSLGKVTVDIESSVILQYYVQVTTIRNPAFLLVRVFPPCFLPFTIQYVARLDEGQEIEVNKKCVEFTFT